jgi:probable F420-dependent oxidoreductase
VRIERMAEGLEIIKGLLAGGAFSFAGKHYRITSLDGYPSPVQMPHPPILLGGGGRRMLRLAAKEADIVNVNYNLSEGRVNPALVKTGVASATDEKLAWIKEAAGDRVDQIELSVTIFFASITEDRETLAAAVAGGLGSDAAEVLETPHFLIGTVDEIVESLTQRRERYGISYVILPGDVAEAFARVVERLSGT